MTVEYWIIYQNGVADHPETEKKSYVPAWKNLGLVVLILFAVITLASHFYPVGSGDSKIRLTRADTKRIKEVYQDAIHQAKTVIPNPERAQFAPFEDARFFRENGLIKIQAPVTGIDDAGETHKGELTARVRFLPEISGYKFEQLSVVDVRDPVLPEQELSIRPTD